MTINVNRGGYRIPLYDNLKAIGIIMVVLGHVTENHYLGHFIYSFHMPLFFFISGVLYKKREHYALQLARSTLWPYLVFALLSFTYWALIETRIRPVPEGTSMLEQFTNIFYPINMGEHAHVMNVVLWFLPALYLCSIAFHYLLCRIGDIKAQFIASVAISIILQFVKIWLPFCIPQALGALPFFALGHLLNGKIRSFENAATKKKSMLCVIAVIVFITLWLYSPGGDMRIANYPMGYVHYFLIAICAIVMLCMTCPRRHVKVFDFLGCNSLIIMLMHEPLKRIIIKTYSVLLSTDMDILRESILHSLIITAIVLLVLCPFVLLTRKHCEFLIRL